MTKISILIIFIIVVPVAVYFAYPWISGFLPLTSNNLSEEKPLNPEEFGLPPTAKEIVSKRTDKTATFSLGENHFAQVSIGGYDLGSEPLSP